MEQIAYSRLLRVSKPIFIIGCGRSGTTLLFRLISQHSQLVATHGYPDGEDHDGWIQHGHCVMAGIGNTTNERYENGINGYNICLHMTENDVDDDIISSMHEYYLKDVILGDKNMRVVNKQPHLSNKLRYVLKIFPDAKIIHIVRDCEPMVGSFVAAMKNHPDLVVYWPEEDYPCLWLLQQPKDKTALDLIAQHKRFFPGGGERLWVDYWCKVNGNVERQMMEHLHQLCVVRYEDILARPKETLNALQQFCELPVEPLDVAAIELGRQGRFSHLVSQDLAAFASVKARPLRRRFGYERSLFTRRASRMIS